MTDELKQKLTERFEQLKESSDIAPLPIYLNDALLKAYLAGGEYGYELGYTERRIDIGSTVSDQVCENNVEHKQINTFKCLVNGEISLSWNTNNILKLD